MIHATNDTIEFRPVEVRRLVNHAPEFKDNVDLDLLLKNFNTTIAYTPSSGDITVTVEKPSVFDKPWVLHYLYLADHDRVRYSEQTSEPTSTMAAVKAQDFFLNYIHGVDLILKLCEYIINNLKDI